ncbi:SWI/SNF and RSC complex subunit Ssr4 [Sparganum proliferum]
MLSVKWSITYFISVLLFPGTKVKYRDYTSKEALLSSKTVILLEGRATCTHDELNELYAVLGDTVVPVTFSDEHKKLPKGYYTIRFYDDEGYLSVRKAQSLGQPIQSIKPVFSVDVYHGGVWLRPWIHSETVALLTAALVGLGALFLNSYTSVVRQPPPKIRDLAFALHNIGYQPLSDRWLLQRS